MSEEVTDLRKSERFDVVQTLEGSFGGVDVTLLNLALNGVQLTHAAALRIGTRGRLTFRRGEVTVTIEGRVVWSHLSKDSGGLLYRSGVQLDEGDVHYAAAIAALLRAGVLARDSGSLERKRQREVAREKLLGATPKMQVPPSN
jgi:hypothetical protein